MHHLETHVERIDVHVAFWDWLLVELGWEPFAQWGDGRSWKHVSGIYLVLARGRAGAANHIALNATSRAAVDMICESVEARGGSRLYVAEFPYAGGRDHYAAYFLDPGGIKFEIVG